MLSNQKIQEKFASSEYMRDIKGDIKQVEADNGGDEKLDNTTLHLWVLYICWQVTHLTHSEL